LRVSPPDCAVVAAVHEDFASARSVFADANASFVMFAGRFFDFARTLRRLSRAAICFGRSSESVCQSVVSFCVSAA
jgi:hypothetical protein